MARQKPPSKAGAFWRAINVREDLAHGSAQGFVLERSAKRGVKSFAPLRGKPPYGAPKAPVESGGFLARHIMYAKTSRTTERRDSCSSEAKSFAPLWGKPPYGAPKAPVESGGFLARHKCTRRPRARQCAGIRARAEREARRRQARSRRLKICVDLKRRSAKAAAGNDERAFVRVLSEKEREARKPRQGMTSLKRCDIIDVWSIAFRTYTDTMSCSAA